MMTQMRTKFLKMMDERIEGARTFLSKWIDPNLLEKNRVPGNQLQPISV